MEPTLGGGGGGSLANDTASSYSNESALELGLSLCSGGGGGGGRVVKGKGSTRGEYGRILTAKDFGSGFPGGRVCGGDGGGGGGVLGTKRGAECVSPPESGSASSVSQVVGWPPIRAHRMNSLVSQTKTQISEQEMGVGGNEKTKKDNKKMNHGSNNESLVKETGNLGFVKVNMDGLPIGRKVDLNSHACYESLARAIEEMFFKPSSTTLNSPKSEEKAAQASKLLDGSSEFVLTYEDKEGDWMLVGDVPWGMFLSNTVRRLRIMKTSEANGLAPRCQENLQFSKKTKEK